MELFNVGGMCPDTNYIFMGESESAATRIRLDGYQACQEVDASGA
jgi:hypothetical protein